ncbi:MAG: 5-(carboxyamino)imidazole ribonucleotide synthase [Rhizobiaceae bacterium]
MSKPLPAGSTIGIIGGGQLGRMLAMAAARLSYRTIILEPGVDCPAAQVANRQIVAAYDDSEALDALTTACDVVTYEFENVPVSAAQRLAVSLAVRPPPKALEVAQDRLVEKEFLNKAGLNTAPFQSVGNDTQLRDALAEFGGGGVLKTRRLGYDGKGQKVFRNANSNAADGVFDEMGGVPLILEGFIDFEREISVIAARNEEGVFSAFDPAENVHRDGILHTSTLPAQLSPHTSKLALDQTEMLMEALGYVGVIGVEFFVTPDEGLLANEFAPRVHNSGHWTEAACAISQFEQHIRAIAGLPLGTTNRHSNCVMQNLIGNEVDRLAELSAEPGTVVHLYGKAEPRPGRKMGHFTRISQRAVRP